MRAKPLGVPLRTDPVAPHRLVTGRLAVAGGSESDALVVDTALFFVVADLGSLGRVTFEGLDSIRTSRGELAPYDDGNDFSSWVYVVTASEWLAERHAYEWTHYETPLLDSHQHYVFRFHDDYVEALASGIWLDTPAEDALKIGVEHPLAGVSASSLREVGSSSGLTWELTRTTRSDDELLEDARLCSQPLFEFSLVLDGKRGGGSTCWLRSRDDVAVSRLTRAWTGEFAAVPGIARPEQVMESWEKYCREVADRRKAMGK